MNEIVAAPAAMFLSGILGISVLRRPDRGARALGRLVIADGFRNLCE